MVVFDYIKKPIALLLSLLIIISTIPVMVLFAGDSDSNTYIEVFDPFVELRQLTADSPNLDTSCTVDFSGSNFSIVGTYDAVKNVEYNSGYNDSQHSIFTDARLSMHNSSFRAGSGYNALHVRQAYNGHVGNMIQLIFTAPYSGKYKVVPEGIRNAGNHSMILEPKDALNSSSVPEHYTQTFSVIKGTETLWSKTLSLSAQKKVSVTDDIATNIEVELAKNEKLIFEFKAPKNWAPCDLYANFDVALVEYLYDEIRDVYFPQENYLVEKSETLQLSPVIVPSTVANSNVTYTVSDTSVLTVDSNGKVTPKAEGYSIVTVITEDGGLTDTTTIAVYDKNSPSYSAKALYNAAVEKLGGIGNIKTVDNDITLPWSTLYKNGESYVKHEALSYTDWSEIAFHAADKDEHGNASAVMVSQNTLSIYNGRQDTTPNGTAIEFIVPEYGIYALTSDGNNGLVSLLQYTLNYIGNSSPYYFNVNFYLNDEIIKTIELSATHTSENFPVFNYLELQKDDKIRIELVTDCWERGGIAIAPKMIRVLEEHRESPVTDITLSDTEITLSKNGTKSIFATVSPIFTDDKTLVYQSTDTAVATVDDNGLITAVGIGEAFIRVSSKKYPIVFSECKVTIAGPTYSSLSSIKDAGNITSTANTMYNAKFEGLFSAGIFTDGEYSDFKYVVNPWGNSKYFTNNIQDTAGNKSSQFVEVYNNYFIQIGSLVEDSWVYTGFTVDTDGLYTLKPNDNLKNIELSFQNGANSANSLIEWGEDYPVYARITKNGQKIWPAGDAIGYELKPSGNNSVQMPTLENLELYKGDIIRVEILGQNKVARHMMVHYNYDITMTKSVTPAVKVENISIDKSYCELIVDETTKISATVLPLNATNKNVIYVSSDDTIASVTAGGVITALKQGTATIYAISGDNAEIKASCIVDIIPKGPEYNVLTSLMNSTTNVTDPNAPFSAEFNGPFSAGILSNGEYTDFQYVINQWGQKHKQFTNEKEDLLGGISKQYVEYYNDSFVQTASWIEDSWVYTGFTVSEDGMYTFKPNSAFKKIELAYTNGVSNADSLIKWGEDHPIYIRITKNGEKIWPLSDTIGYELKPSGENSVAMPTLEGLELYKGDVIRVEVLGQNKVGRHLQVVYNYDIAMRKTITPAVKAEGISLPKTNHELYTGDTLKLEATVTPQNATNKNVRYESSDSSVATVNASGVVTAVKNGNAKIYVISCDNETIKTSCDIEVIQKGPTYNVITSLKETADNVLEPNKVYDAEFKGQISAGILKNDEYTDFKYVVNQWGQSQRQFTNQFDDTQGTTSTQYVEVNSDKYASIASWVADSWVYTAFTVDADGIYNIKPNKNFKNIELGYINGVANAETLVSWGEDYPVYVRITKNGEKIWPLGDTIGYELKPSGENSVAMPEFKDMELYNGDIIRVEILGQNKVGRHLEVRYNYDIEMMKAVTPAVKVNGIKPNKSSCELYVGDTFKLEATVTPQNATNKNIRYESSDNSVLSVTSTGLVTALGKGMATIYVISCDNDDIKDTCIFMVNAKGVSYDIADELNGVASGVNVPNKVYDANFNSISAGILENDEYTDFEYVVNQWGQSQIMFTNNNEDLVGGKSNQFVEHYGSDFLQIGSWVADSWVYTGYTVEADGVYTLNPDKEFKDIQLAYLNGANSAQTLIGWGEDYPVYVRITKNGEKIWPLGDTKGYELKPSGENSVAMPEIKDMKLYKGDVIRFEVSGQNKVGRHLTVRYNYNIDMLKANTPDVKVTGISLDKKSDTLYTGDSLKLNATVTPDNATNKNVYFESSAPDIVSVSNSGVVTALKEGSATIYAVSCDNTAIKTTFNVTVIKKGPTYNVLTSLKASSENVKEANKIYDVNYNDAVSAGALSDGEYTDFKYAVNQWGTQIALTNNKEDVGGTKSKQFVEFYSENFVQIGSLVANSWVYTGFTVEEDGIYNLKPNKEFKNIELAYINGANSAQTLIGWGEDYPVYVRITKNGEKIWPLSDTEGYELKPSGENSVAMPEIKDMELYKGDVIRVEVLGQNKVARHMMVRYNYEVEMMKATTSAVKVTGIDVDRKNATLYTGDSFRLLATITPNNATNKNVYFESSAPDVVSVTRSGIVTALKQGNATVYAVSYDNNSIKAGCEITTIQKGPSYNVVSSLTDEADIVENVNAIYDAKFYGPISAGILSDSEYSDFKYVANKPKIYTNNFEDINGVKSKQLVDFYNNDYVQIGSLVADSWVYTGFTVAENGIYNLKPNKAFKNIELAYTNGANSAQALIDWNEDYPVYVRITKNGEKIWPLSDTVGYELKPSGENSVAMPEIKDMKLYKGDVIRVEVLGQDKVARHLMVRYNYDVEMLEAITPNVNVSGISLDKKSATLYTGDSLKLNATVTPDNATNKNVYFESSAPDIVSVSNSGVITALKKGTATVYAVSYDNASVKASCKVTIKRKVSSHNVVTTLRKQFEDLNEAKTIYNANFEDQITAGVLSAGEYTDFKYVVNQWGTSQLAFTNDEDTDGTKSKQYVETYTTDYVQVASLVANSWVYTGYEVLADGVYNFKPNSAFKNIELTYVNGANSAQALVDWGEDYPVYVRITKNGEKIWPTGDTEGYELKPSGENSVAMPEIKDMKLYKGDVIRVEILGQNKVGRHMLIRYNYDIDMLDPITPDVRTKGISLDKKSYELSIGQSVKLNATVTPKNATNKNVRFESSNPDIASVSASGVVTTLKQGQTTIYAISCDDSNVKASCDITVTSFKVIDYSPLDLFPSIERQLNGKISVTSLPIEFDTNWSAQGLNAKGVWEDAYNLTTYDWNFDNVIDCREFGYGWKNAVGIEGKQPYMLSETGTVSMLFTATRAGIYRLAPDPAKSMISIPNTFLTSRVPVKDRDKEWTFKIYNNDKELFSTTLSCKGVNAVEFPTIENIKMMSGDNIRFVLENCEAAESQIDIYFAPIISLITPDKQKYPPTGTDSEFVLEPNTSIEGKIKAVHPNGLDIFFQDISPKSANSLVIEKDGSFTYTPKKDYKGIDEREIRLSDERGNTSTVKLRFIVSIAYDAAQIIMNKLLSFDPKATGVVQNMTFDNSAWRFQYTYDGLTYPNGSPKYYDTDLAECIENPGWKGYTTYSNGMPQATVRFFSNIPAIDIMAGEKPWNTSPIGAATFVAPADGTYLLRGNEKLNKFMATNAGENGITQPIKVWISKNGQKIWPVDESAVELTAENSEIEFPELQIAMKMGDTVKICVSGHPDNWRKNTVAIAPIMYDLGAYNEELDPVTEPEGGVIIVDDDGEPRVRYTNFSLRKSKKSVSDDPFIEPIIDKKYTVNKITKLKKLEAFKMSATYKECIGVDTYVVNVYRETEYGYELFAEQSTTELTVELSDFIEGKYVIQVLALDKRGQYIEIYTARNFKVTKNGNFSFGGFSIVTLIIILGSVTILAVLAGVYVFIIRKRRK